LQGQQIYDPLSLNW